MKRSKRRILIIDRLQVLREQLSEETASFENFAVVGFYKDVRTAFLSLPKSRPEIIVIVIDSIDESDLRTIGKIKTQYPSVKLLVETDVEDDKLIFDLLTIGLAGLSNVSKSWDKLVASLSEIENGVYPASKVVTKQIFESFQLNKFSELSSRQNEILRLMILGATHITIAEKLGISKDTAKTHMKNIYRKLHVHSREQALTKAVEERLILVI
ncbi:MAG TPA: response regulator transcription factor [Chryseosolibacter sp.]